MSESGQQNPTQDSELFDLDSLWRKLKAADWQLLAVVGPTASGKSELAERLAAEAPVRLGRPAEIVSGDAMQVYRGMDVGTAKLAPARRGVPYHCIDIVDPDQEFSAALYQRVARAAIDDCLGRGVLPIVCGGTGLYIRAALDDFHLDDQSDAERGDYTVRLDTRAKLEREAAELGAEAFYARLVEADPESAELIHPHNVRRVVRAFEFLASGTSYAKQHSGMRKYRSFYRSFYLAPHLPREQLYARINQRVAAMFAGGLVEEVLGLERRYSKLGRTARQAIGYRELLEYGSQLAELGPEQLSALQERVAQDTRHYAKRQLTWLRRDPRIHWFDPGALA